MDNEFKISSCVRGFCAKGCGRQDKQLNTYDYLAGIPGNSTSSELVEVQFKHTRKGYYRNDNHLPLEKGDMVAVEATPGHDIGVVTLTGQLVPLQMKKANLKPGVEIKRVYRKARPADLEKYEESKALEQNTMIRSRKIAQDLNLNMKIGDVEYQGDGNKAIFYYIADARVDFRQLIKVLADAFHVRIEMKQIGARQEAGRIGGIGPCGRELCCATWMKNFNSVSTTAARFQDISPNPQKLAGQCAKLKCCLNYEVDTYVEASKKIPQRDVQLETADATYYLFKTDILAGLVTYSTDKRMAANLVTITAERAQAIIQLNKAGEKPVALDDITNAEPERPVDLVEQEDLHRFDKSKRRKNANNKRRPQNTEGKRDAKSRDGQPVTADSPRKESEVREEGKERRTKGTQQNSSAKDGNSSAADGTAMNSKNGERRNPNNRARGNRNGAAQNDGRNVAGNAIPGNSNPKENKGQSNNRPPRDSKNQTDKRQPNANAQEKESKSQNAPGRAKNSEGNANRAQGSDATQKGGKTEQSTQPQNTNSLQNANKQNKDDKPKGTEA